MTENTKRRIAWGAIGGIGGIAYLVCWYALYLMR